MVDVRLEATSFPSRSSYLRLFEAEDSNWFICIALTLVPGSIDLPVGCRAWAHCRGLEVHRRVVAGRRVFSCMCQGGWSTLWSPHMVELSQLWLCVHRHPRWKVVSLVARSLTLLWLAALNACACFGLPLHDVLDDLLDSRLTLLNSLARTAFSTVLLAVVSGVWIRGVWHFQWTITTIGVFLDH